MARWRAFLRGRRVGDAAHPGGLLSRRNRAAPTGRRGLQLPPRRRRADRRRGGLVLGARRSAGAGWRRWSGRLSQVVECRYFGGLTEEETAEVLGVTRRTVQRDWVKARARVAVPGTQSVTQWWLIDAPRDERRLAGAVGRCIPGPGRSTRSSPSGYCAEFSGERAVADPVLAAWRAPHARDRVRQPETSSNTAPRPTRPRCSRGSPGKTCWWGPGLVPTR